MAIVKLLFVSESLTYSTDLSSSHTKTSWSLRSFSGEYLISEQFMLESDDLLDFISATPSICATSRNRGIPIRLNEEGTSFFSFSFSFSF